MFYDRRIRYIEYLEGGTKVRGGGFVKMEVRQGRVSALIQVERLCATDTVRREILLRAGEVRAVLGSMDLRGGRGIFRAQDLPAEDLGGGIGYGELEDLEIILSPSRVLRCRWGAQERRMSREDGAGRQETGRMSREDGAGGQETGRISRENGASGRETGQAGGQEDRRREREASEEAASAAAAGSGPDEPCLEAAQWAPEGGAEGESAPGEREWEADVPGESREDGEAVPAKETAPQESEEAAREKRALPMAAPTGSGLPDSPEGPVFQEDKWRRLWGIYPRIRPFRDDREYLSLRPEDFVVLREEYYPLAGNSFLLHGFYNYEHLILARIREENQTRYYLGVPGNFYEKEKQAALLFGFEGFEGGREPIREGDFGYYMISVGI